MIPVAMTIINPGKECWPSRGSNQRPPVLKSATLPTKLWGSEKDGWTDTQTDRQADRQTDRQKAYFSSEFHPNLFVAAHIHRLLHTTAPRLRPKIQQIKFKTIGRYLTEHVCFTRISLHL